MENKFTQKTIDTITTAQNMAREAGNPQIVPEHLLFALIDQDGGLIASLFKKMGADTDAMCSELDALIAKLPTASGSELYPSRETSAVLRYAEKAAKQAGDEYISVEHLMLGLFEEGGRDVRALLSDHNITRDGFKKALAAVYFLRRGLPFIYQGQEIGMENKKIRSVQELDDISSIDSYEVARRAGLTDEEALETITFHSRDNARTPMQWSDEEHAGFTTGDPWLKENPNYTKINVQEQQGREDSVLSFYKKLIALRKDPAYKDTFVYGDFVPLKDCGHNVIAYLRESGEQTILVAGNFNAQDVELKLLVESYQKAEDQSEE